MFGRRQKRVEDEPLVPHGLVGQATEETEETSRGGREVIPFPRIIASIPNLNRPVLPQVTEQKSPHSSVLNVLPLSAAHHPGAALALQTPAINSVQMIESKAPNESIAITATAAVPVGPQLEWQRFFQDARHYALNNTAIACRWLIKRYGELGSAISSPEKFTIPARKWLHLAANRVSSFRERASGSMAKSQVRIQPWLRSQACALLGSYRKITGHQIRVHLRWPSRPKWLGPALARLRTRQLQSRGQSLSARIRAEWILQKRHFAADSRAWTALAMGTVCALIALGFISVVRDYATAALPSHQNFRPSNVSTVNSNEAFRPVPASSSAREGAPKGSHPAAPSIANAVKVPLTAARKPTARPRRKGLEEDDYVAKDTYVVYDQHKPSH
jgi:hypothetical protein